MQPYWHCVKFFSISINVTCVLKCTIRVYAYVWCKTYSWECSHKPHTYIYTRDGVWTPWYNHYTTFTPTTLDIRSTCTYEYRHPIISSVIASYQHLVTSVHAHTICHECVPGSTGNLCTGPIWTYKKPYLEPPIPLRVRHVEQTITLWLHWTGEDS